MASTPAELYARAKDVRRQAYAPYSRFEVGAALLTIDGRIFTGVNVENASYSTTVCAERAALAAAVTAGARAFSAIAIAGPPGARTPPCGACRQALAEFGESLIVIFGDENEGLIEMRLDELLPQAFHLPGAREVRR
ncbi:MAG TPA: cytidine deaminase [Candidatus Binatia bacterium]|nr:cytidine deaminase [Candidatus Binatia bacterium]